MFTCSQIVSKVSIGPFISEIPAQRSDEKKRSLCLTLPISEVRFPFFFTKCNAGSGFSFFLAYGYATRQIVPLSHSAPSFVYISTMTFPERRAGPKLVPLRLCIGINDSYSSTRPRPCSRAAVLCAKTLSAYPLRSREFVTYSCQRCILRPSL
jgi:hypothetical protein